MALNSDKWVMWCNYVLVDLIIGNAILVDPDSGIAHVHGCHDVS